MRIVVIGKEGQLARALDSRGNGEDLQILCVGRPELDLERPQTIAPALTALSPDIVVNAAAYTAVDLAEQERERAFAINATGAGAVAETAARLGAPVVQISTDYVFDGRSARPYVESDPTAPLGAYGASKLEGEKLALAANPECVVLRTAWVYSPFGKNFVRTMLRLATTKEEIGVVADQVGSPTSAFGLADQVIAVVRNVLTQRDDQALFGIFHAVDEGEASWAEFASAIFERSREIGGPAARVKPIATTDYPTPAARPANSRLSTENLQRIHKVRPRPWREQLAFCVDRLIKSDS
jgi:dTDP-4-dehydrorhamnose reductase